jgi:hypothetical protein
MTPVTMLLIALIAATPVRIEDRRVLGCGEGAFVVESICASKAGKQAPRRNNCKPASPENRKRVLEVVRAWRFTPECAETPRRAAEFFDLPYLARP